jgi:hypothetical protein
MIHYIDCWQDAVVSQPMWIKPHLEKPGKVMVARAAAASKYRQKNVKSQKTHISGRL